MRSEDLDEEPVVDERDAVDPHNPEGEGNGDTAPVHEHTGWLSHFLPHMSIPFPSVPALSARLPFTRNRQSSGETGIKGENGEKQQTGRQVKVHHKTRLRTQPSMNHLELSRTNSSYPEDVHVKHAQNTRFQAVRDSFPKPSLPKIPSQRPRDPFDCLQGQDIVLLGGYRGSILRDAKTR